MIYIIRFEPVYGENKILIPISGQVVTFPIKYGTNRLTVPLYGGTDVTFEARYGASVIEISTDRPLAFGLTNLFDRVCTVYNDIPERGNTPRHWKRTVLTHCNVQGQSQTRISGTVINLVNQKAVMTKDIGRYLTPEELYAVQGENDYYTACQGDFVVFGDVSDIITTPAEWAALQQRYKDNGIKIQTAEAFRYGWETDHIYMTN